MQAIKYFQLASVTKSNYVAIVAFVTGLIFYYTEATLKHLHMKQYCIVHYFQ